MSQVDWSAILASKPEEAERPKPAPVGTYLAVVTGFEFKVSSQKATPFVQYKIKLVAPMEDVDQTALATYGGMEKLTQKEMTYDLYMTDDSKWRHREFLENTLKIVFGGRGWQPAISESTNKQLKVHIAHKPSADGKAVYANIDDTAAV